MHVMQLILMELAGCPMYHPLRSHMPLVFVICSMQVYFGDFQDSFQALAFCALTGPRY